MASTEDRVRDIIVELLGVDPSRITTNARFREALRIDSRFYPALKNLAVNELNHGQVAEARRE